MMNYWLLKTDSSFCPNHADSVNVYLLGSDESERPAFYICFYCKYVGQVGVGVVPDITSKNTDRFEDEDL